MKIKRWLLFSFCLFSFNSSSFSQRNGNYRVAVLNEISFFNSGTLTSYGFSAEYFIHKNFSLNYQYSLGINQKNNTYLHYPGAVAGFVEMFRTDSYFIASSANEDGWAYLLFLTFVIPEGVSFHTYPRKWLELSPFINPLGCDFNILDNNRSTLTFSVGLKIYFKPSEFFFISPHFGLKHIYRNSEAGNFYGISMGWMF